MRPLKTGFLNLVNDMIVDLPTPANINYLWNFGSLLGLNFVIMLITGIGLSMHYCAHIDMAFESVENILRNVNGGYWLKNLHANGASMFFALTYLHMSRGIYYRSFLAPRRGLWLSGILIFVILMATAFLGYVLPWGQMSYWGATVITNLFSVIPFIGDAFVQMLWGGYSVDCPTLQRFYSLHYLLPFILAVAVILHLALLHEHGSTAPMVVGDTIRFHPYFTTKDLITVVIYGMTMCVLVCWFPNLLGHPDNFIEAAPLSTPLSIVPEWYFLPFYAILRAIPDKSGGVLAMAMSIIALAMMCLKTKNKVLSQARRRLLFSFFLSTFCILTWLGAQHVEVPYTWASALFTFLYFGLLLFL